MHNPSVSVIIPVKNAERTLAMCLNSLAGQTYLPAEVIVVDNGSTDNTVAIARYHATQVIQAQGNLPAARNAGVAVASGELLLHLDADMELNCAAIEQCVRAIQNGSDVIIIPERNVTRGYWMHAFSFGKELTRGIPGMEGIRFLSRAWFERVGGYDETLYLGEDRDFYLRLVAQGAQPGRVDTLTLHHVEHLTIRDLFHKSFQYLRTRAPFETKHRTIVQHDKYRLVQILLMRRSLLLATPVRALGWLALNIAFVARNTITRWWWHLRK